jgi:hypothetical protein
MQRIIIATCVAFILAGCISSSQYLTPVQREIDDIGLKYTKDEVQIDFGESYQDDEILLLVNGKRVFSKVITTPDDGAGFTDSIGFSTTEQHLELRLVINGEEWKSKINLNNGHFFCIMFEGTPIIEQAKFPFYYD